MTKKEILVTTYGEIRDMISCYKIENGELLPKAERKHMTYEQVMALR